jgi:hypothetical protein
MWMRSPRSPVDTPLTEVVFSSQRSPVLVIGNRSPHKLMSAPPSALTSFASSLRFLRGRHRDARNFHIDRA